MAASNNNNNNGYKEHHISPNFYLTTLNDDNGDDEEDEEGERPSMETLDRKIPNPFEVHKWLSFTCSYYQIVVQDEQLLRPSL